MLTFGVSSFSTGKPPLTDKSFNGFSGNPGNDYVVGNVMSHHRIGTDNHAVSNAHTRHYCCTFAYPHVIANVYRLSNDLSIIRRHIGQ